MEKVEKLTIRDHVINIIQRYRVVLIALVAILALSIVALIVYEEMHKANVSSLSLMIEQLDSAEAALANAQGDEEKANLKAEFQASVTKASEQFKGSFAHQRALYLDGKRLFNDKSYAESEAQFLASAEVNKGSYLAPVALLSAAFSAESAGTPAKAIEHLTKLTGEYEKTSAIVGRAYFNLGRLQEAAGDFKAAAAAYQKIIDNDPSSNWTKFAKNRIISLKAQNKL